MNENLHKKFDEEFCTLLKKYNANISVVNNGRYGYDYHQIEINLGLDGCLNYGDFYEGEGLDLD